MFKKSLILLSIILLVGTLNFVFAEPPFQQEAGTDRGLTLRYPPNDIIKEGTDVSAHMHVYNSSDGLLMTNSSVDCFIDVYNASGFHIIEGEMGFDDNNVDFEYEIGGGNFTLGRYSFIIWCNSSWEGGFVSGAFEVNSGLAEPTTAQALIHGIILFVCLFFLAVCIWGAVAINGKNEFHMGKVIKVNFNKYLKQGLFFLSYLFLIFTSGMAWIISTNYLSFDIGTRIFELLFTILWIALLPIFIVFVVFSLIKWVFDMKLMDLAKRNLPMR